MNLGAARGRRVYGRLVGAASLIAARRRPSLLKLHFATEKRLFVPAGVSLKLHHWMIAAQAAPDSHMVRPGVGPDQFAGRILRQKVGDFSESRNQQGQLEAAVIAVVPHVATQRGIDHSIPA